MANNYVLLSTQYPLDMDEEERAREVMAKACIARFKDDPDSCGIFDEDSPLEGWNTEVEVDATGVWFHHDESADADFVAAMISALQKEFHKDTITFGYCFLCSKARLDEFGGGAYAILPDGKILHCDPESEVRRQVEAILKKRKQRKDEKKSRMLLVK